MLLSAFAKADSTVNDDVKEAYGDLGGLRENLKRDYEIALKLDQEGNCHGANILAILYDLGLVVKEDKQKSRELKMRSANGGCGNAASSVGFNYKLGFGGYPRDLNKAIYWHSKAFDLDNNLYCNDAKAVATIYDENGNYLEALNWYKKANQKSCANQEINARIQALEVTQQKQAEAMREDPPVAGITLSLSDDAKPAKKSKKKK
ncbi:MAG: hypothetical protein CTY12_09125 [Methylotenera sp.]|nr:MAG: hypothetical protein CTY12_09125 [Methylotenera sp.]